MATKKKSCENTSQTNVDFKTTESDAELQNIFRKLRVNHRVKRVSSQARKVKSTKLQPKMSGCLPEKHKRRKVLKDPTFIFTSTLKRTETERNLSVKDLKAPLPQREPQRTSSSLNSTLSGGQHRIQGCGEQFRKEASIKVPDSLNMDDTTPEELAAYFDQLLHIPKPMSQMAEMMYT